jgi:nucleoside-diphosphate-sugar epimerase
MRIVIVGASGNVGTALLRALGDEPAVTRIVGLARRRPTLDLPKVEWVAADIVDAPLEGLFRGADAVVHLAWAIQPTRDRRTLVQINVTGSRRVFEAAAAAGVGTLVYASSVGSYSPGPKDARVDERWPTNGIASSYYSRDKAATERLLDRLEAERPELRVVRVRPGVVLQREAAAEIRRLFLGPFVPVSLARPELVPILPLPSGLRIQAVHAHDLADAYRRVIVTPEARGAYNVAAEPVLDTGAFARALRAVELPVPTALARAAVNASWLARLQPINSGWLDMGLRAPIMNTTRIREELGWAPQHDALSALEELLDGLRSGDGYPTPPLDPAAGGPGRLREILTGIGGRQGTYGVRD